jgi:hypothetical protein
VFSRLTRLWQDRTRQITELRVKVQEGRELASNERRIRELWSEMQQHALPQDASLAEQQLLQGLERWERESRASVRERIPQWKQDADEYKTLECRINVAGDLRTLSRFLFALERDPMALKVQSIELNSRDNNGQMVNLGLQVSGLVLLPRAPGQVPRQNR